MIWIRRLALRNLGWKLLALFLGMLVWFVVNARITGGFLPGDSAYTRDLVCTVAVISSEQVPAGITVTPRDVLVTVRGKKELLLDLIPSAIRASVDVSDMKQAFEGWRPVQVSLPPGVGKVGVEPSSVRVQISPPGRTPSTEPTE